MPDDCTHEDHGYADLMTMWLNKLTVNSNPNNVSQTHDLTKPCLICKKAGHTFADCLILNNDEFLKTAFIKTCLFFSTVHQAQAKLGVKVMCAQLNMLAPEEAEYDQIQENAREDFENPQDFCKAEEGNYQQNHPLGLILCY